ncbi:hypothetical protein BGAL_0369g00090 [Botrytis galanthina]|uniref:Uncharacterized protein n=1 Tax=Botrytis galanthina TaxID=278940 RepID=A0A4S8QS39_9HELO|nr:hypothetical protein BGAL_0369g00090 [Botrytis galanthina]
MVDRALDYSSSDRTEPPNPLILSLGKKSHSQAKLPLATAKAKHLAGFNPAPGYPGARLILENDTRPNVQPTMNGPRRGPKSCACRGSRAVPNDKTLCRQIRARQEDTETYSMIHVKIDSIK